MARAERVEVKPPVGMLLEVTHRCPLHCLYCSNPLELTKRDSELDSEAWMRVIDEAADLGVLQVHFSGGEPLLRPDLLPMIELATKRGMFSNLITSGIGLTSKTLDALVAADLGCFQLSLQGADPEMVQEVSGGPFWKKKMEVAEMVREAGLSLTVNAVLHAKNLHQTGELIDIAMQMGADEIELANTQYYGWALLNREHLLPSPAQLAEADRIVQGRRERYGDRLEIIWVVPDYFDDFPKPCMGGWGDSLLTICPDGKVLPCLAANVIPDLDPPSINDHSLRSIWYDSSTFNAFRGFDWMEEPCRSCSRRFEDFGGCRCQAYLLTGSATATDPVCIYSPKHDTVVEARQGRTPERPGETAIYREIDAAPS